MTHPLSGALQEPGLGSTSAGPSPKQRQLSGLQAMVLVGTALAAIGLVVVVGHLRQPPPRSPVLQQLSSRFAAPATGGSLAERVSRTQDRLRTQPDDSGGWAVLGSLYVESARVSADPNFYPKAEGALGRSLTLRGEGNWQALAGQAALANARHDFAQGLVWADRARQANPDSATVWGSLGDSLLELGRYDEGFDAVQHMVDLEPSLASYARVSYARELQGDVDGAIVAMEAALKVASSGAQRAFAEHQLGELYWNRGDVAGAVAHYGRAIRFDGSFVAAQAALARSAWAEGRTEDAIAGYRSVVDRQPLPQYVAQLADLYTVTGQPRLAQEQLGLLDAQQQLQRASGVNIDLENALVSADHRVDLARGLEAAQAEWGRRKSVFVADALAWQLHANGRDLEAVAVADQALAMGTSNAQFHYHRALILLALGQRNEARDELGRALAINPNFSVLHAGRAADLLGTLRAA